MIIAIKGSMGSGKDELANMIQFCLTEKSTGSIPTMERYARFMDLSPTGRSRLSNSHITTFAKPLETIVAGFTGIPLNEVRTHKTKNSYWYPSTGEIVKPETVETFMKSESDNGRKVFVADTVEKLMFQIKENRLIKIRALYQFLGTEVGRNIFDKNVWAVKMFKDYRLSINNDNIIAFKDVYDVTEDDVMKAISQFPLYIVPDLRMLSEYEYIMSLSPSFVPTTNYCHLTSDSAFIISLIRHTDEFQDKIHQSVNEIDKIPSNITFDNNGTKEDLLEFAKYIVNRIER